MIIGLGNPGPTYENTRHNVGFCFVQKLAKQAGIFFMRPWLSSWHQAVFKQGRHRLVLVKPLTYVNGTGRVLPRLFKRFKVDVESLLVVVDQLDLAPGRWRLKPQGGDAGHNGLKSIATAIASQNYRRLWLGIGRPERVQDQVAHVLGRPDAREQKILSETIDFTAKLFWDCFCGVLTKDVSLVRFWEIYQNAVNQRQEARS